MRPQLVLEWREEPAPVRCGVVEAAVAWCDCGWREAESMGSRSQNQRWALESLELHRARCASGALREGREKP